MDRVTVVVDTREQEPYTFESGCTEVVRRALPAGDYSIEGHEDSVAVERKTLEAQRVDAGHRGKVYNQYNISRFEI